MKTSSNLRTASNTPAPSGRLASLPTVGRLGIRFATHWQTRQGGLPGIHGAQWLALAFAILLSLPAHAQFGGPRLAPPLQGAPLRNAFPNAPGLQVERTIPDAAGLRTNPELNDLMERARLLANAERYELAAPLWQRMIDESVDSMVTDTNWNQSTLEFEFRTYRPVESEITKLFSTLPKAGLDVYRLKADAAAEAVVANAGPDGREAGLGKVLRNYFFSSKGDDAAFELSGRFLDRLQFQPAARLLERVVEYYPEPDVNMDILKLRLAVAYARSGKTDKAKEIVGALKESGGLDATIIAAIEKDVAQSAAGADPANAEDPAVVAAKAADDWPVIGGNPERAGVMRALAGPLKSHLKPKWTQPFMLKAPKGFEFFTKRKYIKEFTDTEDLLKAWEKAAISPRGEVLFRDGLVYFRNDIRIVCLNMESGQIEWMGTSAPETNPAGARQPQFQGWQVQGNQPKRKNSAYTTLFEDSRDQSFALIKNLLVSVEPDQESAPRVANNDPFGRNMMAMGGGARGGASRYRKNVLEARDALNGKLRWMIKAGTEDAPASFLGAPTPYNNLIIVPVLGQNNQLSMAAFDLSGEQVWRTFLCDEAAGMTSAKTGLGVAVSAGEIFISTGNGLVFSLDATTGGQTWAFQYPRSMRSRSDFRGNAREVVGWQRDHVLVKGDTVYVFPSDYNQILAIDRASTELKWVSPKWPFTNDNQSIPAPLGFIDGQLIVQSGNALRAYKLDGGRILWSNELGGSLGRGMITAEEIIVPAKRTLYKFSSAGKIRAFETLPKNPDSKTEMPGGNLFTDGKNLLVYGLREIAVYAADGAEPAKPAKAENPGEK